MPLPLSLHLSTARTWRGGENQILLLAAGLRSRGHPVLVAAPPDAPLLERCAERGIPTEKLRIRGEFDPLGMLCLHRLIKRSGARILHLHDGHAVLPGHIVAKGFSRERLAVVAHRRTVFRLKSRWKYGGRIDRIVAISQAAREAVLHAGLPAERVRVVFSGLDFPPAPAEPHAVRRAFREQHRIPQDAFLFVHAAALTREKRQADMLAAVKACGLPGVHLALAGSGPEAENLRALAEALQLRNRIHFLDFLRDVQPLWWAGDAAFFASEAEGLCTALIEAQAAGLPAVITQAGGMVEVVSAGETGLCVPVGDVAAQGQALGAVAADAARRVRMAAAARERMRRLFSSAAMVDGMVQVYEEFSV